MCNTEQNYAGGNSHATNNESAVKNANGVPQLEYKVPISKNGYPKTLWFGDTCKSTGSHTVTTLSSFGAIMQNPEEINELRQDIRAWFTNFITIADESLSGCTLNESIAHYEVLDNFLSALLAEGIAQITEKGGRSND